MFYIAGLITIGGDITWQELGQMGNIDEGVTITFPLFHKSNPRESIKFVNNELIKNKIEWLKYEKPNWILYSEIFKEFFKSVSLLIG